jgi:2'-5' RNA ligase
MALMRLFIAINIDAQVRAEIFDATEPVRRTLPDARWVEPELLHLTVKFLGSRDPSTVGDIVQRMDRVASAYRAIPFEIGGMGAFPNLRRPAVVWMGVQADAKLELLNHDVESACADMGIPVDGRPFRPHITLGRIRMARPESVRELASACNGINYRQHSRVHSLDLMMSHHMDGRLAYSLVHSSPLGGQ